MYHKFNTYSIKVENMKNNISSINAIRNYVNYLNQDLIFIDLKNKTLMKKNFGFFVR